MGGDTESLLANREWMGSLARRLVGEEGEDLDQEAAVVALEAQRQAQGPAGTDQGTAGSLRRPWLGGVLRDLSARRWRAEAHRRQREERVARPESMPGECSSLERSEVQSVVAQELAALGEPFRTVLLLRYFDGLSVRAIASREGVAVGTVHSRLSRGTEQMRGRLERRLGADAWMPAMVPLVSWQSGAPWWKWAGGAALLVLGGGAWTALGTPPAGIEPLGSRATSALAQSTGSAHVELATVQPQAPSSSAPSRSLQPEPARGPQPLAPKGAMELNLLAQGLVDGEWKPLAGAELGMALRWPGEDRWTVTPFGFTPASGCIAAPQPGLEGTSPLSWDVLKQRVFLFHPEFGQRIDRLDLDSDWPRAKVFGRVRAKGDVHHARLVDRGGQPVVGADLVLVMRFVIDLDQEGEPRRPTISRSVTDWRGRFQVPSAFLRRTAGQAIHWEVHPRGSLSASATYGGILRKLRIPRGQPVEDLVWDRGLTLRGRVTTKDGQAVPGLPVSIGLRKAQNHFQGESWGCFCHITWTGWTGEDGSWRAEGLDPGLYEIDLGDTGIEHCTAALPGKVVRSIWEGSLLRVQAVDGEGLPVRGWKLDLEDELEEVHSMDTRGASGAATFSVSAGQVYTLRHQVARQDGEEVHSIRIPAHGGLVQHRVMVDGRGVTRLGLNLIDGAEPGQSGAGGPAGPLAVRILPGIGEPEPLATFEGLGLGRQVLGPLPVEEYLVQPVLDAGDVLAGLVPARSLVAVDPEETPRPALSLRFVRGGPVQLSLAAKGASDPGSRVGTPSRQEFEDHRGGSYSRGKRDRVFVTATRAGRAPIRLHPVVRTKGGWGPRTPYPGDWWLPGATETSVEGLDEGTWTLRIQGERWETVEQAIEVVAGHTSGLRVALVLRGS